MRVRPIFISLGFLFALCGCGGHAASTGAVPQALQPDAITRTSPSFAADLATDTIPSIAGTYKGSIDDERNGGGKLTIVIDQTEAKISGTATPEWKGKTATLTIAGKVWVSKGTTRVRFSITYPGEDCTGTAKGSVKNGHLDGSYAATLCTSGKYTKGTYKTTET